METGKPYPTDTSDREWALVAPYLTLMTEDALWRDCSLREVFKALRWIMRVRGGAYSRTSSRPGIPSTARSNSGSVLARSSKAMDRLVAEAQTGGGFERGWYTATEARAAKMRL